MNKKLIIAIVTVLALSSCRTDMKLAKAFVAEHTGIQAAVYFPEQADVKVEYNTQYERKTEALDGFSQDLFLDVMYDAYADAMISGFSRCAVEVFPRLLTVGYSA